MKISVIGAGYVGLTTAACLAQIGHDVFCSESDIAKLEKLQNGIMPLFEPSLEEVLRNVRSAGRLAFGSTEHAIEHGKAIFICVGTPPLPNGDADLSAIENVARTIAKRAKGYRLVVEKSTVPVQTGSQLRKHLEVHGTSALDYDVASNPEFLREGSAVMDFLHPERIVVGVESERAGDLLREIYEPILNVNFECPVHHTCERTQRPTLLMTDTRSSELIKHASNSFLAMKISFINAVACVCESVGADVHQVVHGIGTDSRIGPRFLNPGIGYGGSCFPKDVMAFRSVARECGYDFRLLDEVMRINEDQRQRFVRKVHSALWTLRGKKLAVLGLAFKGGTDDIRESPALALVQCLLKEGSAITAYDPAAMDRAREVLGASISFTNSPYEAAQDADALLILTEWEEFANLDLERIRQVLRYPIVIDGRNLYDPEMMAAQGFTYYSVGRAAAHPDGVPLGVQRNGKKA